MVVVGVVIDRVYLLFVDACRGGYSGVSHGGGGIDYPILLGLLLGYSSWLFFLVLLSAFM